MAALVGAGVIGDSIGVVDTQFTTMAGITPEAERFTTETISIVVEQRAAALTAVPGLRHGRLTETGRRLEDMLSRVVRAACAQAHTAATATAAKPGAFRRAEAPAWAAVLAAAAAGTVAAAGVIDRRLESKS